MAENKHRIFGSFLKEMSFNNVSKKSSAERASLKFNPIPPAAILVGMKVPIESRE